MFLKDIATWLTSPVLFPLEERGLEMGGCYSGVESPGRKKAKVILAGFPEQFDKKNPFRLGIPQGQSTTD